VVAGWRRRHGRLAAAWRRGRTGPGGPGCPVLPCPVGSRDCGGGSSLPLGYGAASPGPAIFGHLILCPASMTTGEIARTTSRSWWRVLVGGWLGGALRMNGVVVLGVGRNPCWPCRRRRGDARGRRLAFLEGVGCTPSPNPLRGPGETLGLVRTAAASSSSSLLKVLFGTR
jgi:hypothetical protein